MTPRPRLGLSLLLTLIAWPLLLIAGHAPENRRTPDPKIVQIGMTPAQVRDLFGPPKMVARQVYYQGIVEQWGYDERRVEFLFQSGREPKVRAVFTATPPR